MLTRAGCEARKLIASATSSGASQSIWSLVLSSHSCAPASVTWLCISVSTMPGSIAETRTFFAPSSASPDPVLRPRQTRRLRQTRRPRRSGATFKPRASQGIPQTHEDDCPVHSFTSLLADMATICANHIQPAHDMPAFTMSPTPLQRRLRTPRLLPPTRPGVVSTPHQPDHKTPGHHPNPSTNRGELRARAGRAER